MQLNEQQEQAISAAIRLPFAIISGGAGTGKTTIIKEIVEKRAGSATCELCCPTGKAAARLREASGLEARTIHSLLGYNGKYFRTKDLQGLHLIIDEASMLDSFIMAEIIKRKPKALTLVGDDAQLPPVGAGQPFHDLIALRPDITVQLTHCYRSSEAIYQAGSAIRNGDNPRSDKSRNEIFQFCNTGDVADTATHLQGLIKANEIDVERDIILCCKNDAVASFNAAIVATVNPHEEDERWKIGDRIICTKNFAPLDIWNGTTGTITAIDCDGNAWVRGDIPFYSAELDEYVEQTIWNKAVLSECLLAYALTVHKSQGSQYRKVFFACFGGDTFTINRALVYTAVTRAKSECYVLGHVSTFKHAVSKKVIKQTVLQEIAKEQK